MKKNDTRNFWYGFIFAALVTVWLYWLWQKRREISPGPVIITENKRPNHPVGTSLSHELLPDELEQISGIGPTYAKRLNEAGIYYFSQLSELSPEELRKITGVTRWDPADWIEEARNLIA